MLSNIKSNNPIIKIIGLLLILIQIISVQAQPIFNNIIRHAGNVGGKAEFRRLFKQELIYPASALENRIDGKVAWSFLVKKDGTISNLSLILSAGKDLDKEALRLIRLMEWLPAINRWGEKLDSQIDFSIVFKSSNFSNLCQKRGYNKIEFPFTPVDTSFVVHDKVDIAPKFKLRNYTLTEFLSDNLKYPKQAAIKNIQGTVITSFVIEPSGMVSNISVDQPVGGGCSEEAVRLVSLTKWTPGIKNSKAVRTRMILPIGFNYDLKAKDSINREQRIH